MRFAVFVLAAFAAACSPPTQQAEPPACTANCTTQEALTPVVTASIGAPVSLTIETMNVEGEWAWVVAHPRAPDGGQLDWSHTHFASQAQAGALDGDGVTYALLKRENGQWRVLEHAIGPTDVAWAEWPARHGVPSELLSLNAN